MWPLKCRQFVAIWLLLPGDILSSKIHPHKFSHAFPYIWQDFFSLSRKNRKNISVQSSTASAKSKKCKRHREKEKKYTFRILTQKNAIMCYQTRKTIAKNDLEKSNFRSSSLSSLPMDWANILPSAQFIMTHLSPLKLKKIPDKTANKEEERKKSFWVTRAHFRGAKRSLVN